MANKWDKAYRNVNIIDNKINNEIINLSNEMNSQDVMQAGLIHKIPLTIVIDNDGNNLIHIILLNKSVQKTEFNKLNFIKFLVHNDVNPEQPNKNNQTPLHLACEKQYSTIIKYLLECNVNVNYKDNNGLTPLHYLLTGNIKIYEQKESTDILIQPKIPFDINKKNLLDIQREFYKDNITEFTELYKCFLIITNEVFCDAEYNLQLADIIAKIFKNNINDKFEKNNEIKKKKIELFGKKFDEIYEKLKSGEMTHIKSHNFLGDTRDTIDKIIKDAQDKTVLFLGGLTDDNKQRVEKIINDYIMVITKFALPGDAAVRAARSVVIVFDAAQKMTKKMTSIISGAEPHKIAVNIANYIYDNLPILNLNPNPFPFAPFGYYHSPPITHLYRIIVDLFVIASIISPNIPIEYYNACDNMINDLNNTLTGINYYNAANNAGIVLTNANLFSPRIDNQRDMSNAFINILSGDLKALTTVDATTNRDNVKTTDRGGGPYTPETFDFAAKAADHVIAGAYNGNHDIYTKAAHAAMDVINNDITVGYQNAIPVAITALNNPIGTFPNIIFSSNYMNIINHVMNVIIGADHGGPLIYSTIANAIVNYIEVNKASDNIIDIIKAGTDVLIDEILMSTDLLILHNYIIYLLNKLYNNLQKMKDKIKVIINSSIIFNNSHVNDLDKHIKNIIEELIITFKDNYINNILNIEKEITPNMISPFINKDVLTVGYKTKNPYTPYPFPIVLKPLSDNLKNYNDIIDYILPTNITPSIIGILPLTLPPIYNYYNNLLIPIIPYNQLNYNSIPGPTECYTLPVDNITEKGNRTDYILIYSIPFYNNCKKIQISLTNINYNYNKLINIKKKIDNILINEFTNLQTPQQRKDYPHTDLTLELPHPIPYVPIRGGRWVYNNPPLADLPTANNNYIGKQIKKFYNIIKNLFNLKNFISDIEKKISNHIKLINDITEYDLYFSIILDYYIKNFANDYNKNIDNAEKISKIISTLIGEPYIQFDGTTYKVINNNLKEFNDDYFMLYSYYIYNNNNTNNKMNNILSFWLLYEKIDKINNDRIKYISHKPTIDVNTIAYADYINTYINDYEFYYDEDKFYDLLKTFNTKLYIYNFLNNNIKSCKFLIYPNEYSNTTLLKQKYCLNINTDCIELLMNHGCNPYELDNDYNSPINSTIKLYHSESLEELRKLNVDYYKYNLPKNPILIITNELNVHIDKMFNNNYKDSINNFVDAQYNDVYNIMMSNNKFGYNVINYIKESFGIVFYQVNIFFNNFIKNDDISYDYINKIITQMKIYDSNQLINLHNYNEKIKYKQNKLDDQLNVYQNNNYLNTISGNVINNINKINKNYIDITNDINTISGNIIKSYDVNLTLNEFWKQFLNDDNLLNNNSFLPITPDLELLKKLCEEKQYFFIKECFELLINNKNNFNKLKKSYLDKLEKIKLIEIKKLYLYELKKNDNTNYQTNKKVINKIEDQEQLINLYLRFLVKLDIHNFIEICNNKFKLNDNCINKNSITEIKLKKFYFDELKKCFLEELNINIRNITSTTITSNKDISSYFKKLNDIDISILDNSYEPDFKNIKEYFIKLELIGVEYFEKSKFYDYNIILNYINNILLYMIKNIICYNIEMILRDLLLKYFSQNINNKIEDYYDIIDDYIVIIYDELYYELPTKLVKNILKIFKDQNEKNEFVEESVREILNNLFDILLVHIPLPEQSNLSILLNNNLSEYFDMFVEKLIINWLVVIENILKFVINQSRINKTLDYLL